jgi:hypothetical protein
VVHARPPARPRGLAGRGDPRPRERSARPACGQAYRRRDRSSKPKSVTSPSPGRGLPVGPGLSSARTRTPLARELAVGSRTHPQTTGRPIDGSSDPVSISREKAAALVDVSEASVKRASGVLAKGAPELVAAVDAGGQVGVVAAQAGELPLLGLSAMAIKSGNTLLFSRPLAPPVAAVAAEHRGDGAAGVVGLGQDRPHLVQRHPQPERFALLARIRIAREYGAAQERGRWPARAGGKLSEARTVALHRRPKSLAWIAAAWPSGATWPRPGMPLASCSGPWEQVVAAALAAARPVSNPWGAIA